MISIKQQFLKFVLQIMGKKRNVLLNRSLLSSDFFYNKFKKCDATCDYPIIVDNSALFGDISIGAGSKIYDSKISANSPVSIGFCTSINNSFLTSFINMICIGNYCSIAAGTRIIESNHIMSGITTYMYQKNIFHEDAKYDVISKGPIVIGNDVWIGSNSLILSGVNIGNGAIIAAGSVVTHDVAPYTIVGGNPAKYIRDRYLNEELRRQVEDSNWYKKTPEQLESIQYAFRLHEEKELCDYLQNLGSDLWGGV